MNPEYRRQYLEVGGALAALTAVNLALLPLIGYRVVAYVYLLVVLFLALFRGWGRAPTLVAAGLSAALWNLLFIPPRFTLAIHLPEDMMMVGLYFIIAAVVGNLTARIRQQEQAAARERELQAEVARHSRMLTEAEQLHRTLLNSISHELRTPLTAIGSALSHLRHPQLSKDEAMRAVLVDEIQEANERLVRVVQNVLDMARLESGMLRLNLQHCDLRELVEAVLHRLAGDLGSHPVDARIPADLPLLHIDFALMEQVLTNLLRNAAAYTPPGTPITVAARAQAAEVVIAVADRGPGLPADALGSVFDKFYRAPHAAPGGTGLGLSICRGLVEAHHGSIRAENDPAGGARFVVSLPASPQPRGELATRS